MKAPENLEVIGSSLGDKDEAEVMTKTASPLSEKENRSLTGFVILADHEVGTQIGLLLSCVVKLAISHLVGPRPVGTQVRPLIPK